MGAVLEVDGLRAEQEIDPVGVVAHPLLSWTLVGEERGKRQTGYEILAASSQELLDKGEGDLWKAEVKESGHHYLVPWAGKQLKDGQKVHWKVRVSDEKGEQGGWSPVGTFVVGGEKKLRPVRRTSGFESSNEVLNKIYERDLQELSGRLNGYVAGDLGKLGNGQMVQRSTRELLYHFDAAAVLGDWVNRVHDEQNVLGYFPGGPKTPLGPVNSDAAISVPHGLWWMTGDTRIIKKRWDQMEKYMIRREEVDPVIEGKNWGAPHGLDKEVSPEFIELCQFGVTSRLMMELARPAEKPNNTIRYRDYLARVRKSFKRLHLAEDGTLKNQSQTAAVVALRSSVMDEETRAPVIEGLPAKLTPLKDIGSLAAHPLLSVLPLTGNQDLAFDLVSDAKGPWATASDYSFVASGATEWMMSSLLGIDANVSGFHQLRIAPNVPSGDRLKWVKGHYDSPQGRVEVDWKKEDDGSFRLNTTIPAGALAVVTLPVPEGKTLSESGQTIKESFGIELLTRPTAKGTVEVLAQAGSYQFLVK